MRAYSKWGLLVILALALAPFGVAAAQEDDVEPCAGDEVSGMVVDVDEEDGIITVDTGDGLCTVAVGEGDFDHPVVALLGSFFSQIDTDDLAEALEATEVWVVCEDGECTLAEEGDEGAVAARVVEQNDDGTFTIVLLEDDGEELMLTVDDDDAADDLADALEDLIADWQLQEGEDGEPTVVDAGDEIEALHEDGMGFGVIVKLYAMAAESQEACEADGGEDDGEPKDGGEAEDETCGVTVDELVEAFQGGMGMGQLFHEFGRPSMLGVGHVRQAMRDAEDDDEAGDAEVETAESTRPGRGHNKTKDKDKGPGDGNGNGGGNGHGNGSGNGNGGGHGNGGHGNGGGHGRP